MTEETPNETFAMLACDVFNVKEKLSNQEYIDISNKLKTIKDLYDKEKSAKLKLFKEYYKLQKDYIRIGKSFTHLYGDTYEYQNEEDFINFIQT